nr:Uma2 family endonuclease [uncultured Acetatifactor sp.]
MAPALAQEKFYTIDDICSLPEGSKAELIDGQIYHIAPPTRNHQEILSFLHAAIYNYLSKNKGECKVYPAPFAVFLFADDSKYLEPDISVVCDRNKLNDHGCNGAPDWIIEIVSPGSRRLDYYTKLSLYRSANVREYWIVDSMKQTTLVYDMEHDSAPAIYSFADNVKVNIYEDLWIDFRKLNL